MSLELKSVTVTRGKAQILKDISGTLERGQIVGLIGPNGTGKSTLVNAIATIYPFGGTIHWEGRPVKLGEIGYMPQQAHVRASISVTETVLLGRHEGLGWRVGNALVDQAIAMLDEFGIGHLHNRSMHTLSGGQQQLVLLAQRLLREPKLLLLDEATSALDNESERLVQQALERLMHGRTSIIVAHRLTTIEQSDRIIVMSDGRIIEEGTHKELLEKQGYYAELSKRPETA